VGVVARSVSLLLSRAVEPLAVLAAFATIPLTLMELDPRATQDFSVLDWGLWAVFLLELTLMLAVRRERRHHAGLIVIAAGVVVLSCPIWPLVLGGLQAAQLIRLVRLLRLLRLAGAVAVGLPMMRKVFRPGVLYILGLTMLLILSAAGVLTVYEPGVHGDYWNGVWVAIVTAATVGYGDISPHTLEGRVTAVVLMLGGVGLMTTLAASIAAMFVGREEDVSLKHVARRLERVEALLEELRDRTPPRADR
jgi:hypothetical protein